VEAGTGDAPLRCEGRSELLEDGTSPPELLCAKLEAARASAARAGVDLFVNARCDVYLRGLAAPEAALAETLERAQRYRAAGCDGILRAQAP